MALTTNFAPVQLTGVGVVNPTSIQFGQDGRLYVSQQDGIIKVAEVEAITDGQGTITGYQVVPGTSVETITLVQDIPNHNDDGSLASSVNNRQVTGITVEEGANGETVIYVGSSDPRIGGGNSGENTGLDTNSSILSRLTQQPDGTWEKVDLVIGLPRSEENHSINGLDIREEIVDGEVHKILYAASGGNTNNGAPSNNFAFLPETYYSAAVLKIDLTQLEQIESDLLANGGLKGGTEYVDSYVYALPTLDDPTRANDAAGHDTSPGTTGLADAEAAGTFGGNNGLNQAKYDGSGPVQVYSPGYRNHYDILVTEEGNLYTFDNGGNNGWGDKPITENDVIVTSSNQVASNKPNIDIDSGNDRTNDNLHLVTEGFYAGHPNPVYASGAAAGLYTVDTSSGTPVVIKLTDPSDPANDPTTTIDDLPSDWNSITGGITNPEVGVYLSPGKNTDGSNKGADGSLIVSGSSTNGLTEYTANGVSDVSGAEVLIAASFNGNIQFVEVVSDGSQTGTNATDTLTVNVGGTPLDVTAVGNAGIEGQDPSLFAGTIWVARYGADDITVLVPGTPPQPDTDLDNDGLDDNIDPLQADAANGQNTVLTDGGQLFWDFNPGGSGTHPGPSGEFNIGLTGWMINGVDDLEGVRNLDNTIRGGAPGIVQVKSVEPGDYEGNANNQRDAIQTGFTVGAGVDKFAIRVPIFNPFSSDANNGVNWSDSASMGIALGDGTMSNVLSISVGAKNLSGSPTEARVRVLYEEGDIPLADFEIDAPELLTAIDDDLIELFLTVDMQSLEVTPSWRYQVNGVWSAPQSLGSNPIQLQSGGVVAQALQGQHVINGVQSSPVVSLVSTSGGSEPFTADFLDLAISTPTVLTQPTNGTTEVTEGSLTGDSYSIVLSTPPTSDVTVTLAANSDITLDKTQVVFTSANWDVPQIVNILAIDDLLEEGNETVSISHTVSSSDPDFTGLNIPAVSVNVIDNDGPPPTSSNSIHRINVGGSELSAPDGSVWSADNGTNPSPFRVGTGGQKITTTSTPIDLNNASLPDNALVQGIFQSERWDPSSGQSMQWAFDVASGDYEVRLFFAETYDPASVEGGRVFDVVVEGAVPAAFDDIDPFALAGEDAGVMLSHTATVTDGTLNLEFLHGAQNPALKGIEILALDTPQTSTPEVTIGDVTVNEGSGTATFTVNLSEPSSSVVTVDYSTVNGSAIAGSDFTPTSGTLTFDATQTSQTIEVAITNDSEVETNESFSVELTNSTNANITGSTATGTILDDDDNSNAAQVVIVESGNNTSVEENGTTDTYSIVLTVEPSTDVTVTLSPSDQITLDKTQVVFTRDNWFTAQEITITAVDDNLVEGNQSTTINHSASSSDPVYNNISVADVTVNVVDNDDAPGNTTVLHRINVGGAQLTAPDGPVWSADNGANPSPFRVGTGGQKTSSTKTTIDLSNPSLPDSALLQGLFKTERWDPSSGQNMQWAFDVASGDYEVRLFFAETHDPSSVIGGRVFDVLVEDAVPAAFDDIDPFAIAGEDAGVMLSHTATVTDGTLNLEFLHGAQNPALKGIEILAVGGSTPPPATPTLSINDVTVNESDGTANFSVNLSSASNSTVTVEYDTLDGTAIAGSDYETATGTLTFLPGQTSKNIAVTVNNDAAVEGNEAFTVALSNAAGATLADSTASGTILANDAQPELSISDVTVNEGDGTANFTVTLSETSATPVSVNVATANGSAANGDFTATSSSLTFNPGDPLSQTFSVAITDDLIQEGTETFTANLTNAAGATITDGSATGTITDNDENSDPSSNTVLHRINVGGAQLTAPDGPVWSADNGANPSPFRIGTGGQKTSSTPTTIDLSNPSLPDSALLQGLFKTERWDPSSGQNMQWAFDVASGDYEVRLFFAETHDPSSVIGGRVFDVLVEDAVPAAFDDIDPFAIAGEDAGVMLSHTATVTDGTLNLEFLHGTQNPALKGIEILAVGGSTPPPATPTLSIDDVTVNEGNGTANFTVTLSETSATSVSVNVATANDSATNGDFTATSSSLTFNPGDPLSQTFSVAITDDLIQEGTETFTANLTNAAGATITDGSATGTITDNDNSSLNGAAILSILEDVDLVQRSNFGKDSFQITNTGDKTIAQIDIDVTNALYPDSVFDPFGDAGDTATKPLTIDTDGGTGVVSPTTYNPYVGTGGIDGFEGLTLLFDDATNGGFETGETLGFSVDMDPNSVAGANKSLLDAGTDPAWDVGGISGAELIGSSFTVTFTDGSTATGQLQGTNTQAGARGLASQSSPNFSTSLTVNNVSAGESGTYNANDFNVIINGDAGQTARVVLTKGFIQPTTNEFFNSSNSNQVAYAPQLQAQLDALAGSVFPANNAVEFQTFDVLLTGSDQNISGLFDLSGIALYDFAGEDQVPLGIVSSIIDPNNDDLSLGPVSQPIYLQFSDNSVLP